MTTRISLFGIVLVVASLLGWHFYQSHQNQAIGPASPASQARAEGQRSDNSRANERSSSIHPRREITNHRRDLATSLADRKQAVEEIFGEYSAGWLKHLVNPFDHERFEGLLQSHPSNHYEFRTMVHRLTADRDPNYRFLLDDEKLMAHLPTRISLLAYRYALDGDDATLQELHDLHRKHGRGDSDTMFSMGYINDWEASLRLIRKTTPNFDGAAGESLSMFLAKRQILFPKEFEENQPLLEELFGRKF